MSESSDFKEGRLLERKICIVDACKWCSAKLPAHRIRAGIFVHDLNLAGVAYEEFCLASRIWERDILEKKGAAVD